MDGGAMRQSRPLLIIGGGPAGIAAAIEAARAGLSCSLIDEAPRLGGQIYRQPPKDFHAKESFPEWECLRAEFEGVSSRLEVLLSTAVLGVWPNREVLWASDQASGIIDAQQIIIATGAYERPVPFPGWTLPGVMTAGGVQTLIKTMRVRPGRRALVAGTGPLIVSVANRLHEIGVEVVAVLDAARPFWLSEGCSQEWQEFGFVKEIVGYHDRLCAAGIPILYNHTIFAAYGENEVKTVSYGPVDPHDWRPLKDKGHAVDVDLVCIGFGFIPNTELTELAGCRHQCVNQLGGWVPVRDAMMETTNPGIFAAGDGAGIVGAFAAVEEGRIAGITAAEHANAISSADAESRRSIPRARLKSIAPLRDALWEVSKFRPGLLDLIQPDTLVCRCEEISLGEVRGALQQGARDLQAVKLLTRLGMGPCQGRNCAPSMGMYLCQATGRTSEQVGRINPRPPVKPVILGALAQMQEVGQPPGNDSLAAINTVYERRRNAHP